MVKNKKCPPIGVNTQAEKKTRQKLTALFSFLDKILCRTACRHAATTARLYNSVPMRRCDGRHAGRLKDAPADTPVRRPARRQAERYSRRCAGKYAFWQKMRPNAYRIKETVKTREAEAFCVRNLIRETSQ